MTGYDTRERVLDDGTTAMPASDDDRDHDDRTTFLLEGLDRLAGGGFEFHGHLSNHGPMVADALVGLGAGEAVGGWCDAYRPRLGQVPDRVFPIRRERSWRSALGRVERVADWVDYFADHLTEAPWRRVLALWWPRLLPGLAAAGTHGFIRTAHAVRSLSWATGRDPHPQLLDELANGLGYWAARFLPMPAPPHLAGCGDVHQALAAIRPVPDDLAVPGRGIMGHLALAFSLPRFDEWCQELGQHGDVDDVLSDLTAAGAHFLLKRLDLPVVFAHLVTAPSALRFVLPHLSEEMRWASLTRVWQLAVGIVAGFPHRDGPPVPAVGSLSAEDLVDRAVGHGDEHVVKVAEAAIRENAIRPHPVYLHAAAVMPDVLKPLRWS